MSGQEQGDEPLTVYVPDSLPALTDSTARALLVILVELTRVELLDVPPERGSDDGRNQP